MGTSKPWTLLSAAMGLLLVLQAGAPAFQPAPASADGSPFLAGWGYRKQITINGSPARYLASYQMKLTVHKGAGTDNLSEVYLNGHCKDDFADIRFTGPDGTTLLDYWVESLTAGVSAIIWVEAGPIPTGPGTTSIFCYYGNATARTSSSIQNTFVFGDDFDDRALDTANRWSFGGRGGSVIESGGVLQVINSPDDMKWVASKGVCGTGHALHARAALSHVTGCSATRIIGFTTNRNSYLEKYLTAAFRWYYGDANFNAVSGDNSVSKRVDMLVPADTAYHVAECRRYAAGGVNYDKFIMDGGSELSGTKPVADPRYVYIRTDEPSSGVIIDWIFLRKFVEPEPAWGTWGSEEINSGGAITPPAINNSAGASFIAATTAWLSAEVTLTGGEDPWVNIYWGTVDGGANQFSWQNRMGCGYRGAGIFSRNITGLTPDTTYFYRCIAKNTAGEAWTGLSSFKTGILVTAPAINNTAGVTNITTSSARLNGEVTATGGEDPVVHVFWGPSDGGTDLLAWAHDENLGTFGVTDFSKDLAGLSPGATYYYRCYATNSGGAAWAGTTVVFTIPTYIAAPVVTNGSGATNVASTSAKVNGVIVSTGGIDPEVRVYYGTADGGTTAANWQKIKYMYTLPAGPFSGTVSGLASGTTYYYRCWARNSAGTSWASISTSFTTYSTTLAPVVTNSTGASNIGKTSARLNGQLTFNGGLDTRVRIYYGTTDGGTNAANWQGVKYLYILPVGAFYNGVSGLIPGTTYYYRCWAQNAAGTRWAGSSATFTTVSNAPTVTNASGATNIAGNSATFNGRITTVGGENPAVHIYWGTADGGTVAANWQNDQYLGIKSAGAFSKTISQLSGNTTYYYRCYADNSYGFDWADSTASFTTLAGPVRATVTNASGATSVKSSAATLNGEVTGTGGQDPSVRIYYGTSDGGTNAAAWQYARYMYTRPLGAFSSTVTGLAPNTTYYYRCWATNAAGTDWADDSASFTTLP